MGKGCPQGRGGTCQRGDQGGQTYPGAHEGNLLVVEAVHGAGEAGSAPGPLSIDAGPGRGVPPGLRQVRGWGVEGTGRGHTVAPATPGAGSVPPRLPGEPARSCRGGSQPPGS